MKKRRSRNSTEAKSALRDALNAARHYGKPHAEVCRIIPALHERFNLPRIDWTYLRGYQDAVVDGWYHVHLAHRYVAPDGRLIDYRHACDVDRQLVNDGLHVADGHFWKDSRKPFFVSPR